jgi:effector-binding domain-containing protein
MTRHEGTNWSAIQLALGLLLLLAAQPGRTFAQAPASPPAAGEASQAPAKPDASAPSPAAPSQPPPGVPADSAASTLELAPRPVAYLDASAEWPEAFKTIHGEIGKVQEAIKKAGLTQAGHPFAVFLETDDKSFQFEAMVPIAERPPVSELPGGIKIGDSPAGKAMKFLHRGPYDDIDSTYDLITAFLDEKGLESQSRFIEEYLTDTSEPDDANLEADIYVFLK